MPGISISSSLIKTVVSKSSKLDIIDNFNSYIAGTIIGQGHWIACNNVINIVNNSGNMVVGPGTADEIAVGRSESFGNNHSSQIVINTLTTSSYIGPAVRVQNLGTAKYYGWYVDTGARTLFSYVGGTWTQIGVSSTNSHIGDILKLSIVGTTISCYLNGSLDTSMSGGTGIYTNSVIPSGGSPGITGYSTGNTYGDNWEGKQL